MAYPKVELSDLERPTIGIQHTYPELLLWVDIWDDIAIQ
jgi:hypothetical protein